MNNFYLSGSLLSFYQSKMTLSNVLINENLLMKDTLQQSSFISSYESILIMANVQVYKSYFGDHGFIMANYSRLVATNITLEKCIWYELVQVKQIVNEDEIDEEQDGTQIFTDDAPMIFLNSLVHIENLQARDNQCHEKCKYALTMSIR